MNMKHIKRNRAFGRAHSARRGGVLAFVVIAVLAVATLSAGLLQVSSSMTKRQVSNTNIKLAFYMAETGLAEAYQGLAVGRTGNVGTQAVPAALGNGLFWVEATDRPDGTISLDSTGMVGNGSAQLSLVVEPRLSSVAALGVFADAALDITSGVTADGYDSGASDYETQERGLVSIGGGVGGLLGQVGPVTTTQVPLGKLGSNGPVTVTGSSENPTVIDGDISPGCGETVTTTGDVTINGSTAAAECAVVLPPVTVPTFPSCSSISESGPVPLVVLPGQYQMASLLASAGGEVVLTGPASVVLDQLEILDGGKLSFDTSGGPVQLFVNDHIDFELGSVVTTSSQNAWEVTLQVPGTLLRTGTLAATSQFYGVIYAPDADLRVEAPFEMHGSLVGESLSFVGPVQLHYDQHLDEMAEELALPKLISWRIIELKNPSGLSRVMDPFTFLGVAKGACPAPRDAHEDVLLDIKYDPLIGPTTTYVGPESGFNWNGVSKVYSITRDGTRVSPDGGGLMDLGSLMPKGP